MVDYIFTPPPPPSLAIAGTGSRFPVRRIWCVGRNYAAHARELGNDEREPPFFFAKQPDMLLAGGGPIPYPSLTGNLHYEAELVVALKAGGEGIPETRAAETIFGYAAGLDMTRRDLQKQMQERASRGKSAKASSRAHRSALSRPPAS
jgi:fumarylpyruvate hydrolase